MAEGLIGQMIAGLLPVRIGAVEAEAAVGNPGLPRSEIAHRSAVEIFSSAVESFIQEHLVIDGKVVSIGEEACVSFDATGHCGTGIVDIALDGHVPEPA